MPFFTEHSTDPLTLDDTPNAAANGFAAPDPNGQNTGLQPASEDGVQAQTGVENRGLQGAFPDDTGIPRTRMSHRWNKPDTEPTSDYNPYGNAGLTAKQLANIRRSFEDDPLACVEKPEDRARIETIIGRFGPDDQEQLRKSIALAHYYAMNHREKTGFIFDNLPAAIEEFEGKPMSVDQAYESVRNLFNPQQDGIWGNRLAAAATAGGAAVAKTAVNAASLLSRVMLEQVMGYGSSLMRLIDPEGQAEFELHRDEIARMPEEYLQRRLGRPIRMVESWAQQNMNVPGDWVTNSESLGDWMTNAGLTLVNYAPQLAAQIGLSVATGGTAALGVVFGIDGYYDIKGDMPELGEWGAVLYGVGVGAVNSVLEKVSLGIVEGKVSEEFVRRGLKKGIGNILLYLGATGVFEGAEEGVEQLAENLLDIAMGRRGDTKEWTGDQWAENIFQGVPEAVVLGGATGGIMGAPHIGDLRATAERNEAVRTYIGKRKAELDAKDELTSDEELERSTLAAAADSNDPAQVLQAAQTSILNQRLRRQRERTEAQARYNEAQKKLSDATEALNAISDRSGQNAANRNTAVLKQRAAQAEFDRAKANLEAARLDYVQAFPEEETDEERQKRQAEETRLARDTKRRIGWNPQDTVDAVNEAAKQYPDIPIRAVRTYDALPQKAKDYAERQGINPDNANAVWYNDEVYVIADKVRPSNVLKKVQHEVIGHEGLRRVFGKDFDVFLDGVFSRHRQEIEDMGLSALYNTTADTQDGQRLLAEEYLARIAESYEKPSWWKEMLAQIRAYLRKMFPGTRYSDADIEAALIRSARATRKASRGDQIVRFNVAEDTAMNSDEITPEQEKEIRDAYDYAMNGEPVAKLTGNEFQKDGTSLLDRVVHYYQEKFGGKAIHPELGEISLDKRSVKDSLSHGLGSAKAAAFAAVPQVIENGKIFDRQKSWKGHGFDTVVMAAPLEIGGSSYICEVIVKSSDNRKGFYLHEVDVKQKLENAFKTAINGASPVSKLKLPHLIEKVKRQTEKKQKKSDETRFSVSPVWTGSAADYEQPDLHYVGTGEGTQVYGWGLYGSESRSVAEWYANSDYQRKAFPEDEDGNISSDFPLKFVKRNGKPIQTEEYSDDPDNRMYFVLAYSITLSLYDYRRDKSPANHSASELKNKTLEYTEWQLNNFKKSENDPSARYYIKKDISAAEKAIELIQSGELEFSDFDISNLKRNLYKQTFWPDKADNLLDWDKKISEEQANQILDALANENSNPRLIDYVNAKRGVDAAIDGEEFEKEFYYAPDVMRVYLEKYLDFYEASGGSVYNQLASVFNSPKAASEFLYQAGVDGVTYIGASSGIRNYVAFSDKDIRVDEHIRFSLDNMSEEDKAELVTILKPKWTEEAFVEPSEVKAYLESIGETGIDDNTAWALYQMAGKTIRKEKKRARERARDKWIEQNYDLVAKVSEFASSRGLLDFVIRPSFRFKDNNEWPGTFIAKEWQERGKLKPQGKMSDARYLKYKNDRDFALEHADGKASDELAQEIANKYGGDPLEIEEQIIETFRYLKKKDLYSAYSKFNSEQNYRNKQEELEAREEYERYRKKQIEDEVVRIAEQGEPVTKEWTDANMEVFRELYRLLLEKDAPKSAYASEIALDELNGALMAFGKERAPGFQAAYRQARKDAWALYSKRLSEVRIEAMKNKADAQRLQRDAAKFAEQHLPEDLRGEFTRKIINLLRWTTSPSKKHPEGKRMHEFHKILDEMTKAGQKRTIDETLANINGMLESVRIKRNWKGIPTSVMPGEQARVERIRKILGMTSASVANAIDYNNQKIVMLEIERDGLDITDSDTAEKRGGLQKAIDEHIKDNALLAMYGNLAYRSVEDAAKAEAFLKKVIEGGKMDFEAMLGRRQGEILVMRQDAAEELTGNRMYTHTGDDAAGTSRALLRNMNFSSVLRLLAAKSGKPFEETIMGRLLEKTEDSTQKEATANRKLQEAWDDIIAEVTGTKGKQAAERMLAKGRFLKGASETVEKTGVFKIEYSRQQTIHPLRAPMTEAGRSGADVHLVPVEDYTRKQKQPDGTWKTVQYPGARSILNAIDNGIAPDAQFPLDEVGLWFLRKQLEDHDAGIDRRNEFFQDEVDQALLDRLKEEEEPTLMLISRQEKTIAQRVEVPLSQGTALQVLLTWEQEDFRPNMKWNGWTEESIEQIKKFLKPETLKLGYWMRDYLAKQRGELDAAVVKQYGAHLPENANYWPGRFDTNKSTGVGMRGAGTMSINPNFLIARKFHLNVLNMNADAFSVFMDGQVSQNHFLAWTDTIRDLREVFGYNKVQNAISGEFGKDVLNELVRQIGVMAAGGVETNGAASVINRMYRHWVTAKIGLNHSSNIKQVLSMIAYMNKMPVNEFVKYASRSNFTNPEYRAFVEMALKSDYLKNRMAGGLDKDLIYLLNDTRDNAAYSPLGDSLMSLATLGTKYGDRFAVLHGGFAIYQYTLDQARKSGLDEKTAQERARRAWMRATDETQQSGYLKDQTFYQQQGVARFFTVFLSNPIQVMNLELQTLNEIKYIPDNAEAKRKLARQIVVNHLIVPTLMQFTTDMVRAGFNVSDWWDEAEFEDYLTAWMWGPFEGFFMVGKLGMMLQNTLGDLIAHHVFGAERKGLKLRPVFHKTDAIPLAGEVASDVTDFFFEIGDEQFTQEDLADGLSFAGDIGMLYGATPLPGAAEAGSAGVVANAIGTQWKRFLRIFRGGNDEKKSSKQKNGGSQNYR